MLVAWNSKLDQIPFIISLWPYNCVIGTMPLFFFHIYNKYCVLKVSVLSPNVIWFLSKIDTIFQHVHIYICLS